MASYFKHLRRHGIKLYLSFFLGMGITTVLLLGILWVLALVTIAGTDSFYLIFSSDDNVAADAWEDLFTNHLIGLIFFLMVASLLFLLYSTYNSAGIYSSLNQAVSENRFSIGSYFSGGLKFFGKMLGQWILIALITSPLFILFIILSSVFISLLGEEGAILAFALIFIFSIPLALLLLLGFIHAPVILVSEQIGIWKSISYSWKLLFKKFGQVFLSVLFVVGVSFIMWFPVMIVNTFVTVLLGEIPGAILSDLAQFFISPLITLLTLLFVFVRYKQNLRPVLFPQEETEEKGTSFTLEKVTAQSAPPQSQAAALEPERQEVQNLPPETTKQETKTETSQQQEATPTPTHTSSTPKQEETTSASSFPTFTYPDEEKPPR